jgi:hypothetical protein
VAAGAAEKVNVRTTMKSNLSRLLILVLVPLLSGGGPAVGSVRTLLTQPGQSQPVNDEEEHRAKDHACRPASIARRVITHQARAAHRCCVLPPYDRQATCHLATSARPELHSRIDLRNGIGAPLRC